MRIVIHAGMHKTGSTYLQNTFAENRKTLARLGIHSWAKTLNHTNVVRALADDPTLREAQQGPHNDGEALLADIAARKRAGGRLYVLIGEGIGVHLDADAAARLKQKLETVSDEIGVIFYLREPLSFAAASIQEVIKLGKPIAKARARNGRPRYRTRLEPFLAAFPREAIDIRLYDRARFPGGDVLADFFDAIDAPEAFPQIRAPRVGNRSLSVEAVHVWARIVATAPEASVWPLRQYVEETLAEMKGRPFRLSPAETKRILRDTKDELEWLAATLGAPPFAGIAPPPVGSLDWEGTPEALEEATAAALRDARARYAREARSAGAPPGVLRRNGIIGRLISRWRRGSET